MGISALKRERARLGSRSMVRNMTWRPWREPLRDMVRLVDVERWTKSDSVRTDSVAGQVSELGRGWLGRWAAGLV